MKKRESEIPRPAGGDSGFGKIRRRTLQYRRKRKCREDFRRKSLQYSDTGISAGSTEYIRD